MKVAGRFNHMLYSVVAFWLLAGCDRSGREAAPADAEISPTPSVTPQAESEHQTAPSAIVTAARSQVGMTTIYDPAYIQLAYPGGDVPVDRGVCTDVVIRALRDAFNMDLQKLVHEDMKAAFSEYPDIWGLRKPDRSIDHRRVPNLRCYFERKGYSIGVSNNSEEYLAGDLVTCTVGANRPHIMIVSDRKTSAGVPLVIHNIGSGAREEDRLFEFPITGRYRIEGGQP